MLKQIVIGSLALLVVSVPLAVPTEAKDRGRRERVEVRISGRHHTRLP